MDQRPFDTDFDRWLSATMVARPAAEPIAGLAQRVLLQSAEVSLALNYAQRLRRQRRWLRVVNVAAALAIVGAILFAAPGVWSSYQAGAQAWTALVETSSTTASTQAESSASTTSGDEFLWVATASFLAAVIGLALSESFTAGSSVRTGRFAIGYR